MKAAADVVSMIEEAWPAAKGQITHVEHLIPFPAALADHGYQRDLGPKPRTGLKDGIQKTLEAFARLKMENGWMLASWSLDTPDLPLVPSSPWHVKAWPRPLARSP